MKRSNEQTNVVKIACLVNEPARLYVAVWGNCSNLRVSILL